jgi:UDP-2-acetamido-3-amino-2,3-dideoxy-glucuronate N-acetyltransferase
VTGETRLPENVFVHPQALCETRDMGVGTRIWAFAHVLPGAHIGRDVNICDHVFIENDVVIGDRSTVKCFVAIWDGVEIASDVFIGPGVCFSNDRYPRSRRYLSQYPRTRIGRGASIGAGAVLLPGVVVGEYAMVAAGAVVGGKVAPFSFVKGLPARQTSYVCICGAPLRRVANRFKCAEGDWEGERPTIRMKCSRYKVCL